MDTIIVYSSMTGTTELMAETIGKKLTESGEKVVITDVLEVFAADLPSYERILIGSYTWGDGNLPDEMAAFYDELTEIDLTEKQAAVFGPGDSTYPYFAHAVEIWEKALQKQGAEILVEGLKIDRWSDADIETACLGFCKKILQNTFYK